MKITDGISKDEKKLVRKMFWRSMTMYASVNPVTMGGRRLRLFYDALY